MKKEKKQEVIDDNRTIANMNVEGMPWYMGKDGYKRQNQMQELDITKEERRAMIFGAMAMMVPVLIVIVLAFFGVFLFLDIFWLR